jgi:3-oxoacyl-[acyl-carrier protein] reductase
MGPLSGKVAIVTGASMGISKGSVERLTADGTLVIVNYNRESAAADEMVYSIGVNRALAVQADVGTMTGVDDLISATVERFGKIDILLLSAGIQFYAQFNSSVQGAFFLVQVSQNETMWTNGTLASNIPQKAEPHMQLGG